MRITNGLSPRSSTAAIGTTGAVRTSLATWPSANSPPTSTPFAFGSETMMRTCRVAGSATGIDARDVARELAVRDSRSP